MRALGHFVTGVPHERQTQRALARAVGAHERVGFATLDRQVYASQNRLAFDRNVQVR